MDENVAEQIAQLKKRIEDLEEKICAPKRYKKPKAYKRPAKKEDQEELSDEMIIEKAVDALVEAGIIEKDFRACMSKCLKEGKLTFAQCARKCAKEAKKAQSDTDDSEDAEKAKKPKAYKKPVKEPYPEKQEKEGQDEEEEEYKKPRPYKKPYPKKELEAMIEAAIDEALEKKLGGESDMKKSLAPKQSTAVTDPLAMSLEELHKMPFSKIRKGEW